MKTTSVCLRANHARIIYFLLFFITVPSIFHVELLAQYENCSVIELPIDSLYSEVKVDSTPNGIEISLELGGKGNPIQGFMNCTGVLDLGWNLDDSAQVSIDSDGSWANLDGTTVGSATVLGSRSAVSFDLKRPACTPIEGGGHLFCIRIHSNSSSIPWQDLNPDARATIVIEDFIIAKTAFFSEESSRNSDELVIYQKSDEIRVLLEEGNMDYLTVIDGQGATKLRLKTKGGKSCQVSATGWMPGVYWVLVDTRNKMRKTKPILLVK